MPWTHCLKKARSPTDKRHPFTFRSRYSDAGGTGRDKIKQTRIMDGVREECNKDMTPHGVRQMADYVSFLEDMCNKPFDVDRMAEVG